MSSKILGSTLAHGLARRSGREGSEDLTARYKTVVELSLAAPGKQSRSAGFKRWKKDIEALFGKRIMRKLEWGQKKGRQAAYFVLESDPDGTHTIVVHMLSFRDGYFGSLGLIRFAKHAVARLMQSAGEIETATLFRGLSPMIRRYLNAYLTDEGDEMLVLVDPRFGWMPSLMAEDGVLEVRTVIPEIVLGNPHKRELFHRCVDEGRPFLIETRSVSDAKSSIGNIPSTLIPGPVVQNTI